MKTVLFFSLFVIWNVFGVEGEFDGSPRIKAMKVKDITSAEMCAGACQSKADMSILDCLIWRYNKKTKRCIINFVKAKPNRKSTFGFPSSAPPKTTPPPPPPPSLCPEGWSEYEGSCYKVNTNTLAFWNDALNNCRSYEGGDLASIHNEDEWAFVQSLMDTEYNISSFSYYWLGGQSQFNVSLYEWEWSDGSAWNFTPQEISASSPMCLEANMIGIGKWNWSPYSCKTNNPWVCKIQG